MISYLQNELKNCYKFRYFTLSFIISNLKLRYRRSFLGFLWTVGAPFLHYLVIGIIFSIVSRSQDPDFFVYYFTGAILFGFASSVVMRSINVFIGAEHFLKKVYLPKMIFIINAVIYELVNFIFSISVIYVLAKIFGHLEMHLTLFLLPLFFVLFFLFLFGISTVIGIACVYFRDLINIIPVFLQILFFATPIFFRMADIPQKYQFYLELNPLVDFLNIFRNIVLYGNVGASYLWLNCIGLALSSTFFGILILKKFENNLVFKL